MPRAHSLTPFQVDHVIAVMHGGSDNLANLAYACFHCNTHKGPNIAGIDPKTGIMCRLFNPRNDRWSDHFRWNGPTIEGLTLIARATVQTLALNDTDYVALRIALIDEGVFEVGR